MSGSSLLEMRGIVKRFPGVLALNHVDLTVNKGEILALMGENGAGKSTLIKILTGVYQEDEGQIVIEGEQVKFSSVQHSQARGVNAVYQELNMIPYLSAAENIYIGNYPTDRLGNVLWKEMYNNAQEILDELGVKIDSHVTLNTLSTALQQMVSIARAVSRDCKILVLDEPTSSLDESEVQTLFYAMRTLKEKGVGIIFITHRMGEIYQIADNVTILKDGRLAGNFAASELSMSDLIRHMVGREIDNNMRERKKKDFGDDYILRVKNLKRLPKVCDVSFDLHRGEILGITGLLGSGRTETANVLFGIDELDSGMIEYDGKRIDFLTPQKAVKMGIAFCTEDRREKGIIETLSVATNIVISALKEVSNGIILNQKKCNDITEYYIKKLNVKTPSYNQKIELLSGGNQQKVILARWLASNPKLIILDEPTRGIDVGAKREIEKLILSFALSGISVIYISSEMEELVRNCDRVIVFKDGYSIGELAGDEIMEDNIMEMIAREH